MFGDLDIVGSVEVTAKNGTFKIPNFTFVEPDDEIVVIRMSNDDSIYWLTNLKDFEKFIMALREKALKTDNLDEYVKYGNISRAFLYRTLRVLKVDEKNRIKFPKLKTASSLTAPSSTYECTGERKHLELKLVKKN